MNKKLLDQIDAALATANEAYNKGEAVVNVVRYLRDARAIAAERVRLEGNEAARSKTKAPPSAA